jgi:alanyl-tRNA synthetase
MLGNFSFGDYFAAETAAWAYELLTRGYGLERERLWVTVYRDDDETERLWRALGVPSHRIQRLGMADNYWSMGMPGPCGPSSEIFYNRGAPFGRDGGPAVDSERFLEIWNLVFMRFERGTGDDDDFEIVGDLPAKNIDTGLGVDRLAMLLRGVDSVQEIDLVAPTLSGLQEISGREYATARRDERVSHRIVADHVRSAAFLIADGVLPGNEGRGYVLRRLLRRAVRHGRLLGVDQPFLIRLGDTVADSLGAAWPELIEHRALIEQVVGREEEAFHRTLCQGTRLLDTAIERSRPTGALPGATAFELHDTYGFPIDLTLEIAADAGLNVDRDSFARLMDEQRRRAKAARGGAPDGTAREDVYRELSGRFGPTPFLGYDDLASESTVVGLLLDGVATPVATEGQRVDVVLDRSPFYAQAGGQVGDTGVLRTPRARSSASPAPAMACRVCTCTRRRS